MTAPSQPLYKPEPAMLLARTDLHLNSGQSAQIREIESDWQQKKQRLQTAMAGFEPKRGRVDQISSALQGYGQLSREYDLTRRSSWDAALAVLTPAQRKEVRP